MGTITKTITVQMPVTAAYKIVKEFEVQSYPLVKDFGAVLAAPIEDIPNQRYATEVQQCGMSAKIFYDFKPTEIYTVVIINLKYGLVVGKAVGKMQMIYYVQLLKAMEMGYLAALEDSTKDILDICKNCGKELSQEFVVCPFCGTPR